MEAGSSTTTIDLSSLSDVISSAGSTAVTVGIVGLGIWVAWRLACKVLNRGVGK